MRTMLPAEVANILSNSPPNTLQLLDVREPWEYKLVHVKDAILIPLGQVMVEMHKLDKSIPVAVICHHGIRSAHACYILEKSGFDTINIRGGIDLWAKELDPEMPLY